MRPVTDLQVRRLMEEITKHGKLGKAAMMAGMDRKTARKYWSSGKYPSEMVDERDWRTHEDAFSADWPWVMTMLEAAPELEAKIIFGELVRREVGRYQEGQLRTFQRRVKAWRATLGPEKEVYFAQKHRPGEAMQTDFTVCNVLKITIAGEAFPHMLCHSVLPFSNREWATVCLSESMVALQRGVQDAVMTMGKIPTYHQTDHSTAATHKITAAEKARGFNDDYLRLMKHLGMEPRTIAVGKKNQNGDVESSHEVLKRRMEQHLLLRASRDFESVDVYEKWLQDILTQANGLREKRIIIELAEMRPLSVSRLPDYDEERVRVSAWSTIRVKRNTYSVPSRLIGENVDARIYDRNIEIRYGGVKQLSFDRLLGRNGHKINYRHIIWSLVRKPGAFSRYKYREDMFPSLNFRRAYDALTAVKSEWQASLEYLRSLHLAASTMEVEVDAALELLLEEGTLPTFTAVRSLTDTGAPSVPDMPVLKVDLEEYDSLIQPVEAQS